MSSQQTAALPPLDRFHLESVCPHHCWKQSAAAGTGRPTLRSLSLIGHTRLCVPLTSAAPVTSPGTPHHLLGISVPPEPSPPLASAPSLCPHCIFLLQDSPSPSLARIHFPSEAQFLEKVVSCPDLNRPVSNLFPMPVSHLPKVISGLLRPTRQSGHTLTPLPQTPGDCCCPQWILLPPPGKVSEHPAPGLRSLCPKALCISLRTAPSTVDPAQPSQRLDQQARPTAGSSTCCVSQSMWAKPLFYCYPFLSQYTARTWGTLPWLTLPKFM